MRERQSSEALKAGGGAELPQEGETEAENAAKRVWDKESERETESRERQKLVLIQRWGEGRWDP